MYCRPLPPIPANTRQTEPDFTFRILLADAQAAKVYRGISGGKLPDAFWSPNEYNVRGGIEVRLL